MPGTVRPYVQPGTRTTLGLLGPMISSHSHPVFGVQGELPNGTPTRWTPWGFYVPHAKPLNRTRGLAPNDLTRSPGAHFTPPALFQIIGIPEPSLNIQVKPFAGRPGTPPVRHMAINPFPSFRPPLPTYPAPTGFRGTF